MFSTLRTFLVIFLTLLQLIAPLVHAHASEPGVRQGLHLPGLEHYGAEPTAGVQIAHYDVAADGLIVGVDLGLKQMRTLPGADNSAYLHQQTGVFNTAVFRPDTHVSEAPQLPVYRLLLPSPPPRAPPA